MNFFAAKRCFEISCANMKAALQCKHIYTRVPLSDRTEHMPACPPCEVKMNADGILENMCASEFGKRLLYHFQTCNKYSHQMWFDIGFHFSISILSINTSHTKKIVYGGL